MIVHLSLLRMVRRSASLLIPMLCLLVVSAVAEAQESDSSDSIPLRYKFKPGDSVVYRVVAVDSVVIYDVVPRSFFKERVEIVKFRCDAVLTDGLAMEVTLLDYAATERMDTLTRTALDHPWVGRQVVFLMGTSGERKNMMVTDSIPGVAPGAPFQPLLLPMFGPEGTHLASPRNFDVDQWLFDNVYPPVRYQGAALRDRGRWVDTLGSQLLAIHLTETGTVWYQPPVTEVEEEAGVKTTIRSIISGAGTYYYAPERGYPLAGNHELLANLLIMNGEGQEITGRHKMVTTYQILEEGWEE